MANQYTVSDAVKSLKKIYGVKVEDNTITIDKNSTLGNKTWGKIDFLIKNGYTLCKSKDALEDETVIKENDKEFKRREGKDEMDKMSKINHRHNSK